MEEFKRLGLAKQIALVILVTFWVGMMFFATYAPVFMAD